MLAVLSVFLPVLGSFETPSAFLLFFFGVFFLLFVAGFFFVAGIVNGQQTGLGGGILELAIHRRSEFSHAHEQSTDGHRRDQSHFGR